MSDAAPFPDWHGTTILAVRKAGSTVVAGDGQPVLFETDEEGQPLYRLRAARIAQPDPTSNIVLTTPQFYQGAKLYLDIYNAQPGRDVELRFLDDGYEPDRTMLNTRKLIDDDVFALFGYIGTPTSLAAKPLKTFRPPIV